MRTASEDLKDSQQLVLNPVWQCTSDDQDAIIRVRIMMLILATFMLGIDRVVMMILMTNIRY